MKNYLFILALLTAFIGVAQEKSTLFINAHLHVGDGSVIEKATVGIKGENITMVRNTLTSSYKVENWDTIIDLKGAHMYPGIIAPNNTLGLTEIDAVRATRDYRDVGQYNPHVRSLIAFNVESDVMSTVRTNGVLMSQATPRGGVISGSSSIMHLDGWNWEDAAVSEDDGLHLNWPDFIGWGSSAFDKGKAADWQKEYAKEKQAIEDFFTLAKQHDPSVKTETPDLRLNAMKGIFDGEKRLFFHAWELQQMLDIIDFCKKFEIKHPVIVGGYDSHLLMPQLKDAKIPVMLERVHSLPYSENDPVDLHYKLPSMLKNGGVTFCLQNQGDMGAMGARNIPFLAGHTMGYGLSEEEALKAITLSCAKILGIDKMYGSVVEGKKATLFISTGPALDMRTNDVVRAMVNGKDVDLMNRQEELYNKYKAKYESQK